MQGAFNEAKHSESRIKELEVRDKQLSAALSAGLELIKEYESHIKYRWIEFSTMDLYNLTDTFNKAMEPFSVGIV